VTGALQDLLPEAIWITLMVSILGAAVLQYAFYRRLRSAHASVWQTLGSPTVLEYRDYLNAMGRCIWKNEYRVLGDTVLARLALGVKVLCGLGVLAFASGAILSFVPTGRH
jgi:hypothetical protein